jgi:GntR family transcriptional repressor for pyruvate dehydrogenase complex
MERQVRGSRTEEVHRFLLDAITSGEYGAGSRLPSENALASKLGVSRPVVREVVSRLAAEGLVRAERGRGTFVSDRPIVRQLQLSPIDGINDLIAWQDLRIAIEQETARLAAERRAPEDLERIRGIHLKLIDMARVGDRAIGLDFEFHVAIAEATQNPILVEAQRSLGDHIRDWMSTVLETTKRPPSEWHQFRVREHNAILEAIERMDPDGASQAARRHMENGRTRLLTELSQAQM